MNRLDELKARVFDLSAKETAEMVALLKLRKQTPVDIGRLRAAWERAKATGHAVAWGDCAANFYIEEKPDFSLMSHIWTWDKEKFEADLANYKQRIAEVVAEADLRAFTEPRRFSNGMVATVLHSGPASVWVYPETENRPRPRNYILYGAVRSKRMAKKMTKTEMRGIARGAARAYLRDMGIDPDDATAEDALRALDDLARTEPELVASRWYNDATERQYKLFVREW